MKKLIVLDGGLYYLCFCPLISLFPRGRGWVGGKESSKYKLQMCGCMDKYDVRMKARNDENKN